MTTRGFSRRVLLGGGAAALGLTPGSGRPPGDPVAAPPAEPALPAAAASAERFVLLAVDDHLLPFRRNLCYYFAPPKVRREPVLSPSDGDPNAPDHQVTHFYGTVLRDGDRYRMWYYARPETEHGGLACYAESDDGLVWTKPALGQAEFRGSRANNIVALPGREVYGVSVIKDPADPDPRRRYKMLYEHRPDSDKVLARYGKNQLTVRGATSPDGIRWSAAPDMALDDQCEHGSFYRHGDLYVVHGHSTSYGLGGGPRQGRQGLVWVSPDFDNWVQGFAQAFVLPEPRDGGERGFSRPYDQVHLGVGGASFGNVCVGIYGLWHNRGWGAGGTSCDLGLVVSNDGIHFREPVKGHVFIASTDSPASPVEGYSFPTILAQGNGILNTGDETRIYHGRWRNAGTASQGPTARYYRAEVGLATIPRDRWGALGLAGGQQEGWVWSAPVRVPRRGQMRLNGDRVEAMRVEVTDERFQPLPRFSGARSGRAPAGAPLDAPVAWPGASFASLEGRTVRLRVYLKTGADAAAPPLLYAAYLVAA